MHKTEREFKNKLRKHLKDGYNVFVENIESHRSVGIPDLYLLVPRWGDLWVELKNDTFHTVEFVRGRGLYGGCYPIDYRPGQVMWHRTYAESHSMKQKVVTAVALQDGYVLTNVSAVGTHGITHCGDCLFLKRLPSLYELMAMSHAIELPFSKYIDLRSMFVDLVRKMMYDDYDFDADVLWQDLKDRGIISEGNSLDSVPSVETQMWLQQVLLQLRHDEEQDDAK